MDHGQGTTFQRRNQKMAVYSGASRAGIQDRVYRLEDICIRVLMNHLNDIGNVGQCPFYLLKQVLEKCSVAQLQQIERFNPQLRDETDVLWRDHVKRDFKNYCAEELMSNDDDSWRRVYKRLTKMRESKLKALTKKIKRKEAERQAPVKQSKLAPVRGINTKSNPVLAKSRARDIKEAGDVGFLPAPRNAHNNYGGGSSSGGSNRFAGSSSGSSSRGFQNGSGPPRKDDKPKVAPAMKKAMAMYKSRFGRR